MDFAVSLRIDERQGGGDEDSSITIGERGRGGVLLRKRDDGLQASAGIDDDDPTTAIFGDIEIAGVIAGEPVGATLPAPLVIPGTRSSSFTKTRVCDSVPSAATS